VDRGARPFGALGDSPTRIATDIRVLSCAYMSNGIATPVMLWCGPLRHHCSIADARWRIPLLVQA
jgi:hypothetical protein